MSRERYAVMDIGTNAVRAAVYDSDKISASEIYNDKFRTDVSGLLAKDNIDNEHPAYLVFSHFRNVFNSLDVKHIACVATEVLRNHPKSPDFLKIVKDRYNFDINILSGSEEAKMGAMGVVCGIKEAKNGVVADFGGGSLELSFIEDGQITHVHSLPLGSNPLRALIEPSKEYIINAIRQEGNFISAQSLYLIGGAFRMIGRLYMDYSKYPLHNLHNFSLSYLEVDKYLNKLGEIDVNKLKFNNKMKVRNPENLPYACLMLRSLLEIFHPENIVISNYGLKEGVWFSKLSKEEQKKDIILERCKVAFNGLNSNEETEKYIEILNNLIVNPNQQLSSLIEIAIILLNRSAHFRKNINKSFLLNYVLASDIPFNHKQRAILALIFSFMYKRRPEDHIFAISKQVCSKTDFANARIIGNFLSLCTYIDGTIYSKPSFNINLNNDYLEINAGRVLPKNTFEAVCSKLKEIYLARKSTN